MFEHARNYKWKWRAETFIPQGNVERAFHGTLKGIHAHPLWVKQRANLPPSGGNLSKPSYLMNAGQSSRCSVEKEGTGPAVFEDH